MGARSHVRGLACAGLLGGLTGSAVGEEPEEASSVPSTSQTALRSAPTRRCTEQELKGHRLDLRAAPTPCARPAPPSVSAGPESVSIYRLPWNGLAAKIGAHAAVGSEERVGLSGEVGLSYYDEHGFELGVSLQLMRLFRDGFAPELDFWGPSPYREREQRDRTWMPRLVASYGSHQGMWRIHAFGGFGSTHLLGKFGRPGQPRVDRNVESYTFGGGVSWGILHAELQGLGYMKELTGSNSPGVVVAVGVVVPIAFGATEPGKTRAIP